MICIADWKKNESRIFFNCIFCIDIFYRRYKSFCRIAIAPAAPPLEFLLQSYLLVVTDSLLLCFYRLAIKENLNLRRQRLSMMAFFTQIYSAKIWNEMLEERVFFIEDRASYQQRSVDFVAAKKMRGYCSSPDGHRLLNGIVPT